MDEVKAIIFILDDDPTTLELIRRVFKEVGVDHIYFFTNKKDFFKEFNPSVDIVIIDHVLGKGHTGFEVVEEIQKINNKCKIIVLSGHSDGEVIKKYLRMHVVDYIDKNSDIDFSRLYNLVKELTRDIIKNKAYFNKWEKKIEDHVIIN